jgi:hypothetical protein
MKASFREYVSDLLVSPPSFFHGVSIALNGVVSNEQDGVDAPSEGFRDARAEPMNLREKVYEEKRRRRLQKTVEDVRRPEKDLIRGEPPAARPGQIPGTDFGTREAVKEDLFGGVGGKGAFGGGGSEDPGEIRSKRDEIYMRKKMERVKARAGVTDPGAVDRTGYFGGYKPTAANPLPSDRTEFTPRHSSHESRVHFESQPTEERDGVSHQKDGMEDGKDGHEWGFYRTVDGGKKTRIDMQEEYRKGVQEFEDRRHRDTIARVREESGFSMHRPKPPRPQEPGYSVGALPTKSSFEPPEMGKSDEEKKEEYRRQLEEQIKKRAEKRRLEREQSLVESVASGGIVPGLGESRRTRVVVPSPRRMHMPPTRSPDGNYGPHSSSESARPQPHLPSSTHHFDHLDGSSGAGRGFDAPSAPPAFAGAGTTMGDGTEYHARGGTFMGNLHVNDDEIKAQKKQEYAEELRMCSSQPPFHLIVFFFLNFGIDDILWGDVLTMVQENRWKNRREERKKKRKGAKNFSILLRNHLHTQAGIDVHKMTGPHLQNNVCTLTIMQRNHYHWLFTWLFNNF